MKTPGFFVGFVLLCSCLFAQAATYASRSSFNAALGSSTTITFENVTPTPPGPGLSPIIVSGVSFTNLEHQLFIANRDVAIQGTGQFLYNFDSSYPVGVFLPGGKTAFASDFSGGIGPDPSFNATLTVNLLGGQAFSYNFS